MSLKHAILGFLDSKPMTGYELKTEFDRSVQFFWPADQSQIYRTLSKCVEEKLLTFQEEPSSKLLDLKRYYITEDGQAELRTWLEQPITDQVVRDATLIQIFFSGILSEALVKQTLQAQIAALEAKSARFEAILDELSPLQDRSHFSQASFFRLSTLEYGLLNIQAALRWCYSLLERVETGQLRLLPSQSLKNER